MFSQDKHNPLGRFDGLASIYAKYRPSYAAQAIDWIIERLPAPEGTVVDVGCGTGISSRQLAERGVRVIGVEPNESMRLEAEQTGSSGEVIYRPGRGEATGLNAASADGVAAAQAFHWFDGDAALREFHRILRPGGWVTLLWNDADLSDPLTNGFWEILRRATPEPEIVCKPHHLAGRQLLSQPCFEEGCQRTTPHAQELDEEGLLGRAFSASFAPRECEASQRFAEHLRDLHAEYEQRGIVRLIYRTTVYQARRRNG